MRDFRLLFRLIFPLFLTAGLTGYPPAARADESPAKLPQTLNGEIRENLLPLSEQNKMTPEEQRRIEGAAHFMHGILLERRGDYDNAEHEFQKAIDVDPLAAKAVAEAYHAQGIVLEKQGGDFQGAMREYRKAIRTDPNAVEAYRSAIMLSVRQRQPASVLLPLLVEAIKHAPTDFQLLSWLGELRGRMGQLPEAIDALERAVESPEIDKDSAEYVLLHAQLAKLYRMANLSTKAADAYKLIFDVLSHPEKPGLDPAIIDALRSDPNLSYDTAGVVFLEDKRYDLALEAFELAAKNPRLKTEEIGYYKAEIYEAQGKPNEAFIALKPYLEKKMQSRGVAP